MRIARSRNSRSRPTRTGREGFVRFGAVVLAAGALAACSNGDDVTAPEPTSAPTSTLVEAPSTTTAEETTTTGLLDEYDETYNAPSCTEDFSPQGLRRRAFAFDGVVISFEAAPEGGALHKAMFDVQEWFSNMDPRDDPVRMVVLMPMAVSVGDRMLVAGVPQSGTGSPLDNPLAWDCGFTVPHSAEGVAVWRDALAQG